MRTSIGAEIDREKEKRKEADDKDIPTGNLNTLWFEVCNIYKNLREFNI